MRFELSEEVGKNPSAMAASLGIKCRTKGERMFRWALVFLVVVIVTGLLGFGEWVGAAVDIAKFLSVLFLAVSALIVVLAVLTGRRTF